MTTINDKHNKLTGPDSELSMGRVSKEFLEYLQELKSNHDKMLIAVKQIDAIVFNLLPTPILKLNRIKQITFDILGFSTDAVSIRQEDWI